jgi:hypothetical protein
VKPRLQRDLVLGHYRLSPTRRIRRDGEVLEIWSALDSLVLKSIAIVLTKHLAPRLSSRCTHLANKGGAKGAVREVLDKVPENKFVFRTDVKSYYASIQHDILFSQLQRHIDDPRLLSLMWQYMRRVVYDDGLYEDVEQGISLGCPVSPLMGALFLDVLDQRMEATGLCYVRFMDDWVVLAPTRWKLRKAVRIVNETLAELRVEQHPDKTFIGRIEKGFDFLGYEITSPGIEGIAQRTLDSFAKRVTRLYEQGADPSRIGQYVQRWRKWLTSGLGRLSVTCDAVGVGCSRPLRCSRMRAC